MNVNAGSNFTSLSLPSVSSTHHLQTSLFRRDSHLWVHGEILSLRLSFQANWMGLSPLLEALASNNPSQPLASNTSPNPTASNDYFAQELFMWCDLLTTTSVLCEQPEITVLLSSHCLGWARHTAPLEESCLTAYLYYIRFGKGSLRAFCKGSGGWACKLSYNNLLDAWPVSPITGKADNSLPWAVRGSKGAITLLVYYNSAKPLAATAPEVSGHGILQEES